VIRLKSTEIPCEKGAVHIWHLDEMVVRIAGKRMYLWRAVDHEGEVLDMLVQRWRDKRAQSGRCAGFSRNRASRRNC